MYMNMHGLAVRAYIRISIALWKKETNEKNNIKQYINERSDLLSEAICFFYSLLFAFILLVQMLRLLVAVSRNSNIISKLNEKTVTCNAKRMRVSKCRCSI